MIYRLKLVGEAHYLEVVSTIPTSGERDVAPRNTIIIVFSEALNQSTILPSNIIVTENNVVKPYTYSYATLTLTITLSGAATFQINSTVRVKLTKGLLAASGNTLENIYTFSFKMSALGIFTLITIVPADDSLNVAIDDHIDMTFSRAVQALPILDTVAWLEECNMATPTNTPLNGAEGVLHNQQIAIIIDGTPLQDSVVLGDSLKVQVDDIDVSGSVTFATNTIYFTPTGSYGYNKDVVVTLTRDVRNSEYELLTEDYTFTFTTELESDILLWVGGNNYEET